MAVFLLFAYWQSRAKIGRPFAKAKGQRGAWLEALVCKDFVLRQGQRRCGKGLAGDKEPAWRWHCILWGRCPERVPNKQRGGQGRPGLWGGKPGGAAVLMVPKRMARAKQRKNANRIGRFCRSLAQDNPENADETSVLKKQPGFCRPNGKALPKHTKP